MKKTYQTPWLQTVVMANEDVICSSTFGHISLSDTAGSFDDGGDSVSFDRFTKKG